MTRPAHYVALLFIILATPAFGQEVTTLSDLDAQGRVTLTKDELLKLLPDAHMGRVNARGNQQLWKNDADGTFIMSSGARSQTNKVPSRHGKWRVSDDGRYCVVIELAAAEKEDWCRYIVKAGNDYYATRSDKVGTERLFKLEISK